MPLTIRPARLADALDMAVLHHRSVHALAAGYYTPGVLARWAAPVSLAKAERLYRQAQDGGAIQLVAELDGVVAGFASVVPPEGRIVACYVAPDTARRGVGSMLLDEMERIARAAGCAGLSLTASLNAKAFYRARGYREAGRGEHVFADGGEMAAVFMRKSFV